MIILEYILTIIYYLWFGSLFIVFHLIGVIAHKTGGKKGLLKAQQFYCLCIIRGLLITGNRVKFKNSYPLAPGRPLLIITNHQSMYDIPPIIWFLRSHYPLFVAKKELEKGVPFVSYVLRHSGSALIDRKDSRQALTAITRMGRMVNREKLSMVIFPEGTRSKTGQIKAFSKNGIAGLLKNCPDALVVPIAIDNTWKLHSHGKYTISLGNKLTWTVLEPVEPAGKDPGELTAELHRSIKEHLSDQV